MMDLVRTQVLLTGRRCSVDVETDGGLVVEFLDGTRLRIQTGEGVRWRMSQPRALTVGAADSIEAAVLDALKVIAATG